MWIQEVKKIPYEGVKQIEEKKLFDEFCEDYNTVTFPHKKYYSLRAWEKYQQKKQMKDLQNFTQEPEADSNIAARDEFEIQQKRMERISQVTDGKIVAALKAMHNNDQIAQKVDSQIHQGQQMQYLYNTGNVDEARKINSIINPDKKKLEQNKKSKR